MIPAELGYERAGSVDEAVAVLAEHGEDAQRLLAGGHSLIPFLRLRFACPSLLVDIGRLAELSYVRDGGDHVAIGALTRYRDLETSALLAERAGLLRHAASQVGDPQVRHRGTIGGSICHGDPAADLPAVLVALGASVVVRGPSGERSLAASEVFQGFLETALAPDEVLTEIRVPASSERWAFEKFNRRAPDWAIVGCAVLGGAAPRVALVNMGATPVRAVAVEAALEAGASVLEAAAFAAEGTAPPEDVNASPDYRRHLARVLVRRALERVSGDGGVPRGVSVVTGRLVGVVLAAGGGSRFSGEVHKLLAPLGGTALVRWVVDAALRAGLDEVVVVTGSVDLRAVLPAGARVVENPRWADGIASSLVAATSDLAPRGCTDVVVGLGDEPFVPAAAWSAVAAERSTPIAVATYDGVRGHPVRLARALWPDLAHSGDVGARALMESRPGLVREVPCEGLATDVDTKDDLSALERDRSSRGAPPWS